MTWPFGSLRMHSYDVICADPPWDFENYSPKGTRKGADPHYRVMSLEDIGELPVMDLAARNCLLLLWAPGWAMGTNKAHYIARAWHFTPITEMVWIKRTVNGKLRMGTGYRVRTMHEPVLLCITGNPQHKAFPSVFDGLAREHSRKPDEFYDLVRAHTPDALHRADLFSRETRQGFEGWGFEHGKFDEAAA